MFRVDLEVMAMKKHVHPRPLELESDNQMQFNVISKTSYFFAESYL